MKKILEFILGLIILFGFYFLALAILNILHIKFPAPILGLILFSIALINNWIKEDWIKTTVELFLKNMALLFVPFIVGLIVYQDTLLKNGLNIAIIVFITTILTIIFTGLFVEYGIKYLRLHKMRKHHD